MMRPLRTIIFCGLTLCMLLCACGKAPVSEPSTLPETSSAETAEAATETTAAAQDETTDAVQAPSSGFTMEDLLRENGLTNLVRAYTNVRVRGYFNGEQTGETNYFWHDGEVAAAEMILYEGEKFYSGFIGAVDFEQIGDRLQGYRNITGENEFQHEDAVTSMLLSGNITDIKDAGDRWSFRILSAVIAEEGNAECRCVAEKETLALDEIELTLENGDVIRHTIEHSPLLDTDDFGLLDGLDKPTRKVRFCTVLHDAAGREKLDSVTLDVPYNLEIIPVSGDGDLALYMNETLTKEYAYPGNGKAYTVYATDAMG